MARKKTKWAWNEHSEWKDQQEAPEIVPEKHGQCPECHRAAFTLKIVERGRMDRICKNCGHTIENI